MDKKTKTVWIIVGILVVILIGVWIWTASRSQSQNNSTSLHTATTTTATSSDQIDGTEVGSTQGVSAISYANALKLYVNKRIQFSSPSGIAALCQADPNMVTFRSGTSFMLDNRMDRTASIHFSSGIIYTLPPYSFEIVTLNAIQTYQVDCGTSQNVVTVMIEK